MIVKNPIKLNNWEYKSFLKVILGIQLILVFLITMDLFLNQTNMQNVEFSYLISFMRQFVGFFYLAFVPGYVILRILKLHHLSNIETMFYAVGLSLATLILCGFLLSIASILLGFSNPLSFFPLISSITSLVIILCVFNYFIDVNDKELIDLNYFISHTALFLYLLPFLAIIGTFIINYYNNNLPIMILIVIIGITIYLASINKINKKYYALTIFVISISLIFQNSLISSYIGGYDIQREYYFANYIFNLAYWSPFRGILETSWLSMNSLLSITILPSVFSRVLDLDLIWVFKIIYPILLSIIPLGLYKVIKDQTNDKIAFLSCIFLVSNYAFFFTMLSLMREIIAEVFLVLILLVMINNKKAFGKSIVLFISIISLVVSHYGIAFLFLLLLITAWVINSDIILNLVGKISSNFKHISKQKKSLLTNNIIIFTFVFVMIWYIFASDSFIFKLISNIIYKIFTTQLFSSQSTQGIEIITTKMPSIFLEITKYLTLLTQLFISIGIISLIWDKSKLKINRDYFMLSIASLALCVFTLLVPTFGFNLGSTRIYQLSLIFLSPFCILGFIFIFKRFRRLSFFNLSGQSKKLTTENAFKVLSIFFVIFLFFNTGLIQEIMHVPYKSTFSLTSSDDPPIFSHNEISGAKWISIYKNNDSIYSDVNGFVLLNSLVGYQAHELRFTYDIMGLQFSETNQYIYLRNNNSNGVVYVVFESKDQGGEKYIEKTYLDNVTNKKNRIYDSSSLIFY